MKFKQGITYLLNADEDSTTSPENNASFSNQKNKEKEWITLLPVESTVLFPHMTFPLKLRKRGMIDLAEAIYNEDGYLGLVAPKQGGPRFSSDSLHAIGTIAKVLKVIHLSEEEVVVVLQGKERFQIKDIKVNKPHPVAHIKLVQNRPLNAHHKRTKVLLQSIRETAFELLSNMPDVPTEVHMMIDNIDNPDFLVYYIASSLSNFPQTQRILEEASGLKRANLLLKYLLKDLEFLKIQKQIHRKVHTDLNQQQRNFYLKQQIKVLQEELGEQTLEEDDELEELRQQGEKINWTAPIKQYFTKTLQKASRMHPSSAEYTHLLNYAHTFIEIPWGILSKEPSNLKRAQQILEKEHYGMDKIKERITTLLSVQKLRKDHQGRILCLHGPPGVGKTSLCKSIAHALGRKYARISLGGLHDEAELRGHRRTYVGAMMGRIMSAIKNAGTSNPLIVLDEIDKLDTSRGNPAAVLLEILDPAQNHTFVDNYLNVPFDLSKVFFVATANDVYNILPALADRLEMIKVDGYPQEEKVEIAKKHLIPKARKENGLQASDFSITKKGLSTLIERYTNESGVRELYRKLDILCSKVGKAIVFEEDYPHHIKETDLNTLIGMPIYDKETYQTIEKPGVSVGLVWTSTGGEIIFIEALLYKGEGKLITSGQLGDVMEESAITALSYLKANADKLGIDDATFKKYDLHIHVPDGATPKEGPSAGITLFTAIASLYTQRKVKERVAMTGEITLRGNVLPVGGIQDKVLAAQRANIKTVILSTKNKKDIEEIKPAYLGDLSFHYTHTVDEVLAHALEPKPIEKPAPWAQKPT